ncbi:MAG: type I restriction endonuclease subunit R [Candidatus Phytoplasma vitis]|nr:MAG: HsdR family type I site-specific deoxyribonuclease [Candidatus Phytoplasma vitis]
MTFKEMFSEKELEETTIEQLKNLGYQEIVITNQNDLEENFKKQFLKYNLDNQIDNFIDPKQLSRNWFPDLMKKIKANNSKINVLDTYHILRDRHTVRKHDDKHTFLLELFNQKDWCKNIFQVARQVKMEDVANNQNNYRYDIVLFINGLPLALIELKKRGNPLKKALTQIEIYANNFVSLFRYIEILIISNGSDTEYFTNQKYINSSSSNIFPCQWAGRDGKAINRLKDFVDDFLNCCQLAKIIARYIFLHEKNQNLLIMRSHQMHAVERLLELAKSTSNNGYIWHTTGSGKTFTSFALCYILQRTTDAQIFFLTDRKELDLQTFQEFNSFKKDSVEKIESTSSLKKYFINSASNKIVSTLIHKINKLITNTKNKNILESWQKRQKKKIFFIVDECHRTQSGVMHENLKNFFPEARFFGFTGTPLLEEQNKTNEKSTQKLFGECKHSYTMFNALLEKNKFIVPFNIRYLQKRVKDEPEAKVEWIIKNHYKLSQNKNYNALLVAQNIEHLLRYYELFKQYDHSLEIAAIFSNNNSLKESSEDTQNNHLTELEKIIEEYDPKATIDNYHQKILKDMKENKIDILIVVQMFLTGFDSRLLNTLYVDRVLQKQQLFQAFSRTIRKDNKNKKSGNIICFRTSKKEVDESLRLFANDDDISLLIAPDYNKIKKEFIKSVEKIREIAPTPDMVDNIIGNIQKEKDYLITFRTLRKNRELLEKDIEFQENNFYSILSEKDFKDYQSKKFEIDDCKLVDDKKTHLIFEKFEEDKKKYKKFIKELQKLAFTPADVDNLETIEDKISFVHIFKKLRQQKEIMTKYTTFNENDFHLTTENFLNYEQKFSKIQKEVHEDSENIENINSDIIDVAYLENLFKSINKQQFIKDSQSGQKPNLTLAKIIKETTSESHLPDNNKKLFIDFIKNMEKEIDSQPKHFLPRYISDLLKNIKSNYDNFINRKQIEEIQAKANEFDLPVERIKEIIINEMDEAKPESIKKQIRTLLDNNPKAIQKYQNNKSLHNFKKYRLQLELAKEIYIFVQRFCEKYKN